MTSINSMKNSTRLLTVSIVFAVLISSPINHCVVHAQDKISSAETTGGITDAEILDIVKRVAQHQIHPLAEGDYPAVKSIDEAKPAKAPEGIAWLYPWGVTLFGMERSTDVTGNQDADKFVVQHNLI